VDLHREDDPNVLKSMYVREIIDREPGVLRASAGLDEIMTLLVDGDHTEIFVVNEAGELLGAIYFRELRRIMLEQDHLRALVVAEDLLERERPSVAENDDLDVVMQLFSHGEMEEIAVLEPQGRRLVGSVHKRDVITAYNQEIMRRDLAGGVQTAVAVIDRVHEVDLGDGYVVQEVQVPRSFVGRSLRDVNLRHTTGVQVMLIRSRLASESRPSIRVPGPDDQLNHGDMLIVAGEREAVTELASL